MPTLLQTNPIITIINRKLKAWCCELPYLHFHPMRMAFLRSGAIKTDPELFYKDRLHPGRWGIELLTQRFFQLMARHLIIRTVEQS
jgi:hypothetical protein